MRPRSGARPSGLAILAFAACLAAAFLLVGPLLAEDPLPIGSRLELFVDDYLIEELTGTAKQQLHKPVPGEVVLVTGAPWEGNTCAYYVIFRDGELYRMYYRGSHFDTATRRASHPEFACYAESRDGVHWTKPELGIVEFDGSKQNNIVWQGVGSHDFTPMKDARPDCPAEARYKALGRGGHGYKRGLYAFQSADAIHWKLISEEPVITQGAFDSQNLAFYDTVRRRYVDFHRGFRAGVRDIMTCTSNDFLHWTEPVWLEYAGAPKEHLYTNAIRPYFRAPHIFLGFPTRYHPERGSQVEPTLMSSRDGRTFHRWTEALIPVTAPEDRRGNRSNYMAWGLVTLPGNDRELSVYATEAYYTGSDSRLRRFTYRVDGFVSVHAPAAGGEILTRPVVFHGSELVINVATASGGSIRVEIRDADGKPIPGFSLAESKQIVGDRIEQPVAWQNGSDASSLAGKPVRLRFAIQDADLYSIRFRQKPPTL